MPKKRQRPKKSANNKQDARSNKHYQRETIVYNTTIIVFDNSNKTNANDEMSWKWFTLSIITGTISGIISGILLYYLL